MVIGMHSMLTSPVWENKVSHNTTFSTTTKTHHQPEEHYSTPTSDQRCTLGRGGSKLLRSIQSAGTISHVAGSSWTVLEKMQPRPVPLAAMLEQHPSCWFAVQDEVEVWGLGRADAAMAMERTLSMVLGCIFDDGKAWRYWGFNGRLVNESLVDVKALLIDIEDDWEDRPWRETALL